MRKSARCLLIYLLLSLCSAASASQLVAVLEFNGVGLDDAVLLKLSDSARVAARKALSTDYALLTRENIEQILQDNEVDPSCIEGTCEVETGRNIGAEWIITGDVAKLEGKYFLTLKLYQTDTGQLLSATETTADTVLQLIDALAPTTQQLIADWQGSGSQSFKSMPTQLTLNVVPAQPKLQECLRAGLMAKGFTGVLEVSLESQISPTSSVYLPSAVGRLTWNRKGESATGNAQWVAFGAAEADAKQNALAFRNLKSGSLESVCREVVTQIRP